jgi:hypothetical protein
LYVQEKSAIILLKLSAAVQNLAPRTLAIEGKLSILERRIVRKIHGPNRHWGKENKVY